MGGTPMPRRAAAGGGKMVEKTKPISTTVPIGRSAFPGTMIEKTKPIEEVSSWKCQVSASEAKRQALRVFQLHTSHFTLQTAAQPPACRTSAGPAGKKRRPQRGLRPEPGVPRAKHAKSAKKTKSKTRIALSLATFASLRET